jgi:hypothetical protein
MSQKIVPLFEAIKEKGVYGKCSCGGDILFYSNYGVRCSSCNKLYGLWAHSLDESLKRRIKKPRYFYY